MSTEMKTRMSVLGDAVRRRDVLHAPAASIPFLVPTRLHAVMATRAEVAGWKPRRQEAGPGGLDRGQDGAEVDHRTGSVDGVREKVELVAVAQGERGRV